MEAIVLAGGFGTRLKSHIFDVPKPMAPINGEPFLEYLLQYLIKQNITSVILSTGYKHDIIANYFGTNYKGIKIRYSVEDEPLGTGGAIKKALEIANEKNVYIINGDTLFYVNLLTLMDKHLIENADITIALKPMRNFDRYGEVKTINDKVIGFEEKGYKEFGNINGGVYIIKTEIFSKFDLPTKFSFEKDFLEKYNSKINISSLIQDTYFIDIGIPEDYIKIQMEFKSNR